MAFSNDASRIVSTDDRETRIWDISTQREAANLGSLGSLADINFTSDDQQLLIRRKDGTLWILPDGKR